MNQRAPRFFVVIVFALTTGCGLTQLQKRAQHDVETGLTAIVQTDVQPSLEMQGVITIAKGALVAVSSVNRKHDVEPPTMAEVKAVRAAPKQFAARARSDAKAVDEELSLWDKLTGAIHPGLAIPGAGAIGLGGLWLIGSFLSRFARVRSIVAKIGNTFKPVRDDRDAALTERTHRITRVEDARRDAAKAFILAVEEGRAVLRLFDVAARRLQIAQPFIDAITELSKGTATTVQDLFVNALIEGQRKRGVQREIAELRREALDEGDIGV